MTVSLWQRGARGRRQSCAVDLAIIGGGVTGLSAAAEARRRGMTVGVFERHAVGSGASGRNAGYLMRGMASSYAVAADVFGRAAAGELWRLSERNLELLKSLGTGAAAGMHDLPSCLLAVDEAEEWDLRRSFEMLREDGFAVELLEPADLPLPVGERRFARVGLVNPGDAVCDPMALLGVLASLVGGESIWTDDEVHGVHPEDGGVVIESARRSCRVHRVMICTNAWISELEPALGGVIRPCRAQMLAARPAREAIELAHAYYINRGNEYLRSGPDGLLLMGGARRYESGDGASAEFGTSDEVQQRLEDFVRAYAAEHFEVLARWSGVMGMTPDELPVVGPAPLDDRVWICGGFSGHGMSLGCVTAKLAVAGMLGDDAVPAMFNPGRFDGAAATGSAR